MWSSIAIFKRYGCASSAAEIRGKSSTEPPISARGGRAACQRRATSRRSKAFPSRSSSSWSGPTSGTADLLLELLDPPEPRVDPAGLHELVVTARLDDAPLGEHDDAGGRL